MLPTARGRADPWKQNKFKISAHEKFEKVVSFLGAQLGKKQIFVYLNSAFTPRYDETVANLYEWHGGGKLVVNYATTPAGGDGSRRRAVSPSFVKESSRCDRRAFVAANRTPGHFAK